MYAIVKTGGKQYRVEEGQSLLVERLPDDDGAKVPLKPLLFVDGSTIVDGDGLARVKVEARIIGHERGPKLRIVKFKPKRGYRRRTGHRQELTRLEVTSVKLAAGRSSAKQSAEATATTDASAPADTPAGKPTPVAAPGQKPSARKPAAPKAEAPKAEEKPAAPKAEAPKAEASTAEKPAARKPAAKKPAASKPAAPKGGASKPAARRPRTPKPKTEEGNGA
jgi:large subunit ribosomal protein L21